MNGHKIKRINGIKEEIMYPKSLHFNLFSTYNQSFKASLFRAK